MFRKILFFIICFIFYIGLVNAVTYPKFLYSTIWENWVHPTGNFILDITYEDVSVWIDTSTDDLKLYKYDWNSWGWDIASGYVNFWTKSIWKNHAVYSVSWMTVGRYKYVFTIKNLNWNNNTKKIIFYIDNPSLNIDTALQDIWLLKDNLKFLSPERIITVKSIWAPYTVSMTRTQNMSNSPVTIPVWNGTKWWWYARDPYNSNAQNQVLSPLNTVILNSSPLKPNVSGVLNNDTLRFKAWAKEDVNKTAWEYIAKIKFDINYTYCPEYNLDNTCKTYWKKIKTISWARKWEDWAVAKSCYYYKYPENSWYEYLWEIWNWKYWIKPDSGQPAFKAYCDMTSNWWGWTRYVNIKWNYTFQNGLDCWLGTNISNSNIECFNPNRYWINSAQLFNDDWNNIKYYYDLNDSNSSVSTASENGQRKCLGHNEYMTVMKADQTPQADWSDAEYIWMWKDFCSFSRDPAWRSWGSFMNYDPSNTFWENSWAAREWSARFSKLYFREVDLWFTQIDKTILNDANWIKKWSDNTFAKSCNEYKNPPIWYSYIWDTWDWEYWIDSDWIGWNSEFKVLCDMTTDSGWWTQIRNWTSWVSTIYPSWLVIGGEKALMTYKRQDDSSKKYALRIDHFKLKHCWEEYTTIWAYSNHLQTWSWGSCARNSTTWDYNDIKTTEIIWNGFVEDTCVSWNNHKSTARNTSWWVTSWRWQIQYRVSNETVLMWPNWNASVRCAASVQNERKQTEVQTWIR